MCFLQQASRHREPSAVGSSSEWSDVRHLQPGPTGRATYHGIPSTPIRFVTNRRSLRAESFPRRPWPCLTVRFPHPVENDGLPSSTFLSLLDDLGSSFSPTAVPVCRADIVTSRRAASLLGQAFLATASFSTFRLSCTDEVYQNFTCVCHIVRA